MLRVAGTNFKKICTQTAASRILKGYGTPDGVRVKLPSYTPTACKSDSKSKGENEHKYIINIKDGEKANTNEIKPETHREKCERLIIQAFGIGEKEATKNNADTIELDAKNVNVLQATTAKEPEEKLIQKIENIEDPPIVEGASFNVEGVPSTPKSLHAKTTAELLYEASLHNIETKDFEDIATRCLDSPTKQLDDRILEEFDKLDDQQTSEKTASGHEVETPDMLRLNNEVESKKLESLALYDSRKIEYDDDENNSVNDKLDVNPESLRVEYNNCSTGNQKPDFKRDTQQTALLNYEPLITTKDNANVMNQSQTESSEEIIEEEIPQAENEPEVKINPSVTDRDKANDNIDFNNLPIAGNTTSLPLYDENIPLSVMLQRARARNYSESNKMFRNYHREIAPMEGKCGDKAPPPCPPPPPPCPKPDPCPPKDEPCPPKPPVCPTPCEPKCPCSKCVKTSIDAPGVISKEATSNQVSSDKKTQCEACQEVVDYSLWNKQQNSQNSFQSDNWQMTFHNPVPQGTCCQITTPHMHITRCPRCNRVLECYCHIHSPTPYFQNYYVQNENITAISAPQIGKETPGEHFVTQKAPACNLENSELSLESVNTLSADESKAQAYRADTKKTEHVKNLKGGNDASAILNYDLQRSQSNNEVRSTPAIQTKRSELLPTEAKSYRNVEKNYKQLYFSEMNRLRNNVSKHQIKKAKKQYYNPELNHLHNKASKQQTRQRKIDGKISPTEILDNMNTNCVGVKDEALDLNNIGALRRYFKRFLKRYSQETRETLKVSAEATQLIVKPKPKVSTQVNNRDDDNKQLVPNTNANYNVLNPQKDLSSNIPNAKNEAAEVTKSSLELNKMPETNRMESETQSINLVTKTDLSRVVQQETFPKPLTNLKCKKQLVPNTNANYNVLNPQKDFSPNIPNTKKETAEVTKSSLEINKRPVTSRMESETQSINLVTKTDISRVVQQETFPKPLTENKPQTVKLLTNVTKPRVHQHKTSLKPIKKDITPQYINLLTKMSQPRVAEQKRPAKLTEELKTSLNSTTRTQFRVLQQKTSPKPFAKEIKRNKPHSFNSATKVDISRSQQETSSTGELELQSPKLATKISQSEVIQEITLPKSTANDVLESTKPVKKTSSSVDGGYLAPSHEKVQSNISTGIGPIPMKNDSIPLSELLQKVRLQNHLEYCKLFDKHAETAEDSKAKDSSCKSPPKCPPKKESPCKTMYPCKTRTHNDACPPKPKPDRPKNPYPCKSKTGPTSKPCDPTPPKSSPCTKCVSVGPISNKVRSILDSDHIISIPQTSSPYKINKENVEQTTDIMSKQLIIEKIITEIIRRIGISNVNDEGIVIAREFGPWTPIPSWPYPENLVRKPVLCPKDGCPTPRPPKDGDFCKPTQKPCTGFPKRASFSSIDKNLTFDLNF